MPGFSVTPLSDMPPATPQAFPNFIRFQEDGTNLGSADADTLNFASGLTATRGTGENANVVSVTAAAGEGGAAPVFVLDLAQSYEDAPKFDGVAITGWEGDFYLEAPGIEWDIDAKHLSFSVAGLYRITVTSTITASPAWPSNGSTYGVAILTVGTSRHARYHAAVDAADSSPVVQFTDEFIVDVSAPPSRDLTIGIYAINAATTTNCSMRAMLTAQRLDS